MVKTNNIKDNLVIEYEDYRDNRSILIINIKGIIDSLNFFEFKKAVEEIISHNYKKILFNCQELNNVSSTGVGVFLSIYKVLKEQKGDMILLSIKPQVYNIFHTLGFSKLLKFRNNPTSALSELSI
ncbi:MAG: STAS domain-containing protein [Spirochaetes bacterium]|nr:STAS domain-containing protein [Spirochaetota bacterium]